MHKINSELFKKKPMLKKTNEMFQHEMFGNLTVITNDNNELYFIGKEVVEILGYSNVSQTISTHCKGYIKTILPTNGGNQEVVVIPERDLYRLVMRSKKEEAEKFEEWVVSEVLPSIRKHEIYATENTIDKMLNDPDFAIQTFTKLKEERAKRVEAEKTVAILTHVTKNYTVTEIAKELQMKSAKVLNEELRKMGIQFKSNDTWVLYSKYANLGYFDIKQEVLDNGKVIYHRKVTQLGREFILKLFTKKLVE